MSELISFGSVLNKLASIIDNHWHGRTPPKSQMLLTAEPRGSQRFKRTLYEGFHKVARLIPFFPQAWPCEVSSEIKRAFVRGRSFPREALFTGETLTFPNWITDDARARATQQRVRDVCVCVYTRLHFARENGRGVEVTKVKDRGKWTGLGQSGFPFSVRAFVPLTR